MKVDLLSAAGRTKKEQKLLCMEIFQANLNFFVFLHNVIFTYNNWKEKKHKKSLFKPIFKKIEDWAHSQS